MTDDLRFPIGRFVPPGTFTSGSRAQAIDTIAAAPTELRSAVAGLDEDQLDTPYRPGGWTLRQVVHHVPESHMNAYIRTKLALTELAPVIRPYEEAEWSKLPDNSIVPIDVSLDLLDLLHRRWVALFRAIRPEDFAREYVHPETGTHTLDHLVALYAWHGRHHVAHITSTRGREKW